MDRSTFVEHLRRSQLLEEQAIEEAVARLPEDAPARAIAQVLVAQGLLTRYQRRQILAGKAQRLTLGQYRILELLGRGATGRVFKAVHASMDRAVALKVIYSSLIRERNALNSFKREVRTAAQLHHPNIVTAYHADEVRGACFLVMEYVE